ncbi:AraC family transcriptional regulator [Roseibium salinum]|nr:AraC family transcriptional regulator [Roseibium salinum]
MAGRTQEETGQTVAFVLMDRFSMNAFASVIEPLRIANRLLGRDYYVWTTYSLDGNSVVASNGCEVSVNKSIRELHDTDITLLCSGIDVERLPMNAELGSKLRRLNAMGRTFGAICTGAYLLARYHLLDGRRCTIHWEKPQVPARGVSGRRSHL